MSVDRIVRRQLTATRTGIIVLLGLATLAACDSSGGGADYAASADVAGGGYDDTAVYAPGGYGDAASAPAEDVAWWAPSVDVAAAADASSGGNVDPGDDDPQSCRPACDQLQCGPDGCGGSCGWCSASASCQEGVCIVVDGCDPDCAGQMIGADDGCGGVCSGGGFGIGLKPGGAQDVGYFRKLVAAGEVPEAEFFPIEGFLNEHDTPLPAPDYERFVTLHAFLGMFFDPEEPEAPLLAMQLGMNSGIDPAVIEQEHVNLVVVVDVSGSMEEDDKLEFVKIGLSLMLDSLDENDTLAIVTYSTNAQTVMSPTPVTEETKPEIVRVITQLRPDGSTNLHEGMMVGYELASRNLVDTDAIHRIMLLSDGNITAGLGDLDTILADSAAYNAEDIGITTIGVGLDFNFELMFALANQGGGNFYFLDDGAKLVEVFQHDLRNLLTPVAENLRISFRLPEGFFVEDIYGFDFREENGEVVLLGPSAQYTVDPDPDTGGTGGTGGSGGVAVSTLFASDENGLLMVKIGCDDWDVFTAWEAMEFASISYEYDLVDRGESEGTEKVVEMGSLSFFAQDDPGSPMAYFTGPIMQRNYCVLRTALAVRAACELFHEDSPDINGAVRELSDATTFCTAANLHLSAPDPALEDDIAFMATLKDNMCAILECLPQ